MKKLILCFLFLAILFTASSQKVYFVYMQAETNLPFFVKMNEKLYSSTPAGYLILSYLKDTTYNISIGFPQNKLPEQQFSIEINKKDHGYLLKDFDEKGWGLYDLQTSSVQMSSTVIPGKDSKAENQNPSAFTDILSRAADDPSLKEKAILPKAEEKKPEVILQEVAIKEEIKPVVTKQQTPQKEEPKVDIREQVIEKNEEVKANSPESYKRTTIVKKSESSNVDGFGLVFIDDYENGTMDTIRLLIPNPKLLSDESKQEVKEEKKFLAIIPDTSDKNNKAIPDSIKRTTSEVNQTAIQDNVGSKCIEIASKDDFSLLSKRIATEKTDSNKISMALKSLSLKCYTTDQIRKLSALFLKDESKYNFFNGAYPYVSDSSNFVSLRSEFKDVFYVNKFREMLH